MKKNHYISGSFFARKGVLQEEVTLVFIVSHMLMEDI
jgi:hypothetical protein